MTATKTHSKLAPSARYRWQLCPASVRYEAPEGGKSSPSAVDGTHSHTLLEECLTTGVVIDPHRFVGLVMADHEGEFPVNTDRADRVAIATSYIAKRMVEMPLATLLAEQRVDPSPIVGRNDMAGTVDVQIISDGFLEIIDYKDGMNLVEARDNPQLEQYAIGVLAKYMRPDRTFPFHTIRLTIIQPKLAFIGGNPITSADYGIANILAKIEPLIKEAAATDDPEAPFVPGEKQCKYCPNAGQCSSFTQWTLTKSGIKFEDVSYAKAAAETEPEQLSDDKLREIVEAGPLLRRMIDAAEEEALRRIQSGHAVPGLKAVRGRGQREWSKDEKLVEAKLTRMKVPKGIIWVEKLISVAQLQKAKWTDRAGTEHSISEENWRLLSNDYVAMSQGALKVVPESDSRPAETFPDITTVFPLPEVPGEVVPDWLS